MRRGKEIAQASHAVMGVFFKNLIPQYEYGDLKEYKMPTLPYFEEFISGRFKKVCVYVNSEEELVDVYTQAIKAGIHACLIEDEGLTEFKGVRTKTVVSLGPWNSEDLDKITGELTLY